MVHHGSHVAKLGRNIKDRTRLLRNLVSSLVEHERIETTVPRAKELRKLADRVVTIGKGDSPRVAKQRLGAVLRTPLQVHKAMTELAHRYAERCGGYTRVLRSHTRKGDGAPMAFVEFVDRDGEIRPARPPVPPPPSGASIGVYALHEESMRMVREANKDRPSPKY